PEVVSWLTEVDEDRVYLSVASFAEISRGVELMPLGQRRDRLAVWLEDELPLRFEGRVLDIDQRIAQLWGALLARSQKVGQTLGSMDAVFAATAQAHALTLVTRNVADFQPLRIPLVNPWDRVS